jgi:hypothetical protein
MEISRCSGDGRNPPPWIFETKLPGARNRPVPGTAGWLEADASRRPNTLPKSQIPTTTSAMILPLCNAAKRAPEAALPIKARILQVRAFRRQGRGSDTRPPVLGYLLLRGRPEIDYRQAEVRPRR